MALEKGLN